MWETALALFERHNWIIDLNVCFYTISKIGEDTYHLKTEYGKVLSQGDIFTVLGAFLQEVGTFVPKES